MALLELKNVNKVFNHGKTIALHGINLMIKRGEFIAIFGPSDSGKTTLLNLISCLGPPSSGEIYFDGTKLSGLLERDLDQHKKINIGYIPRNNNLFSDRTVYQNVEYIAGLFYKDKIKSRVIKVLYDVGLNGLETRKAGDLNNCQKKRLAIAMVMVKEPVLVLVDEPTLGLDSKNSDQIIEIMVNMNENLGTTFIFATEDIQIIDYAYRIITIRDGMINNGKKEESEILYFGLLEALLSGAR